jgi:hypothetical protein
MGEEMGNPLGGDGGGTDIELALKQGTLTEAEAIVMMQKQMEAQMERRIERLKDEMGAGGISKLAVRAAYARLTEAPTNYHQVTTFFLTSTDPQDHDTKATAPMLFLGGVLMVLAQTLTVVAMTSATMWPACASNKQCAEGSYCNLYTAAGRDSSFNSGSRCWECGYAPIREQLDVATGKCYNNVYCADTRFSMADETSVCQQDPTLCTEYAGYNETGILEVCQEPDLARRYWAPVDKVVPRAAVLSYCDHCVHAVTDEVDTSTNKQTYLEHVAAMTTLDWLALTFSSFVIGLNIVGELKE